MKIPIFPGKYHQNGGFSMAMLVYRRVRPSESPNFATDDLLAYQCQPSTVNPLLISWTLFCAMVKSRYVGDGKPPTFNRSLYNGYINPYYWVDDHPLLFGNNGSLDPSTFHNHKISPATFACVWCKFAQAPSLWRIAARYCGVVFDVFFWGGGLVFWKLVPSNHDKLPGKSLIYAEKTMKRLM